MANHLLIGTNDKTEALLHVSKPGFLLIDDGPIADAFLKRFRAREFDPVKHSFNPLRQISYPRAREIAEAFYTASPQGQDTLTLRNGKRTLTRLFLRSFTRLDKIEAYLWEKAKSEDLSPAHAEALGTLSDALLSPTLRRVLCNPSNFSLSGSVVARLDRAELGDFDAFLLAAMLLSQFKGQIIIPDGGHYLRDGHASLIRQNRLTAGINFLAELPVKIRNAVIGIKDKIALSVIKPDAELLVSYWGSGVQPATLMDMDSDEYLPVGSTSPRRWGAGV